MNQYYRKIGTVIKAVTVFLFIFLFANSISTQAQRVVYRYDTICKGDTGYHTFLDTLLYEDFEEELQDCWMSIYNWYYEQGIDARRSLCLRSSTEYITIPTDCFTPYEGEYAAFESDMRFYGDISMIITPKIEVFDPDNTFVSFYFIMPGTQYNSGYETLEVADEALCALSDEQNGYVYDLDLWHINDNSIVSYLTWTYYRNSFSGYTPGSYHVNFAHNNEGGFGFGLDNLLVYGPRKVDIPANVSSAEAGSTITTQQIYTGGTDCDVTVITQWYIKPKTSDTITVSHTGAYTWATPEGDGNSYSATGLYSKTGMTNSVGCDSTHYLDLTVMEEPVRDTTVTHIDTCATAYTWDTTHETYTTSGTYYYQASELHWEAIVLTLKSASPTTTISPNECDTYTWSTLATPLTFTASTSKDTTLKNQAGCDSLVQLRLTVRHSTTAEPTTITACYSYTWDFNSQTYTQSDTYHETTNNVAGCDSNATLILTINDKIEIVNTQTACDSFYWTVNDSTYLASANDTLRATSIHGCDSLTILNLIVGHPSTAPDSVQTACDSFLWCGRFLHSSGQYPDTITNVDGCDSAVFLTLTIKQSTAIEYNIGACDSFQWSHSNMVYRTSGTYRDTIPNSAGCDSLITLNLTIQTNLEAPLLTSMFCDQYTWSENGQTYTESGTYTDTLRSMYDCDSLIRLDLTILKSPQLRVTPDTTINICGRATIEAHGAQVYQFSPDVALSQTLIYDTVATVTTNPRSSTNYLITAYSVGPELVTNGDFSQGNVGFTTALRYQTTLNAYGVYTIANIARSVASGFNGKDHTAPTTNTGKFMVVDGSESANNLVWGQSVNVKPHTDYIFSFWATPVTTSTPARLQAVINNTDCGDLLVVPSTATEAGNWVRRYFIWNSGSNTTADLRIINRLGVGSGNDFGIDDISLRQLSCAIEHHVNHVLGHELNIDEE